MLADDFVCTNIGPISDIHIWGSWLYNQALTNSLTFWLGVYDDAPTNANNPFSHPGTNLLWQQYFAPGQYAETIYSPGQEFFLNPGPPNVVGTDSEVWYYCFYPSNLTQTGTLAAKKTYWLAAYATLPAGVSSVYGWKTATNVQNDISVHAPWPGLPGEQPRSGSNDEEHRWGPMDLAFKLTTSTNTVACVETNNLKYVQWPQATNGYDVWDSSAIPSGVQDGPWVLAEEFVCTNTGPISDIHIWGSWLSDAVLQNTITFWLGIYSNVPANPPGTNYSQPGTLLWQQYFAPGQYPESYYEPGQEYFLNPGPPAQVGFDSQVWYSSSLHQPGADRNPHPFEHLLAVRIRPVTRRRGEYLRLENHDKRPE